jgi:beta-lactam-binding protein with PASTA domain
MNGQPLLGPGPGAVPAPADRRLVAPDLIGLDLHDACAAAAWAGTHINATSVTRSRGPWGVVVGQSPSPGMRLRSLWQIHVLVATPLESAAQDDG